MAKRDSRWAVALSDCTGVSEPAVYHRLERLRDYGLVTEDIQLVTDGKDDKLYRTERDDIEVDLGEDRLPVGYPVEGVLSRGIN